jgi:hypothetical protein
LITVAPQEYKKESTFAEAINPLAGMHKSSVLQLDNGHWTGGRANRTFSYKQTNKQKEQ